NAQHGTAHSFDKVIAYGNTWRLTLNMNYLPVNVELKRQELAEKDPIYRTEHSSSFESLDIEYIPSPSEQAAGRFDEEGNFLPPLENEDFLIPSASDALVDTEK